MVNCWFGLVVWDSRGTPFHKGIPNIQTTHPNDQLTIGWMSPGPGITMFSSSLTSQGTSARSRDFVRRSDRWRKVPREDTFSCHCVCIEILWYMIHTVFCMSSKYIYTHLFHHSSLQDMYNAYIYTESYQLEDTCVDTSVYNLDGFCWTHFKGRWPRYTDSNTERQTQVRFF